ncbi:hypothetical protein S83_054862 [Arachis hypogaea]
MFQYLAPVVINIQNALSQLGISSNIQVSSPSSLAVLQESYTHSADNPNKIPLDYVLFNPSEGMVDPNKKLHYDNMLYAQVDAVAFAFAKLGFNDIGIKVSERGWPPKGDSDEAGATVQAAPTYNRNLFRRQNAK